LCNAAPPIHGFYILFYLVQLSLEQAAGRRGQVQGVQDDPAEGAEQELSIRVCPRQEHQLPEVGPHQVLVRQQQRLLRLPQVCAH